MYPGPTAPVLLPYLTAQNALSPRSEVMVARDCVRAGVQAERVTVVQRSEVKEEAEGRGTAAEQGTQPKRPRQTATKKKAA